MKSLFLILAIFFTANLSLARTPGTLQFVCKYKTTPSVVWQFSEPGDLVTIDVSMTTDNIDKKTQSGQSGEYTSFVGTASVLVSVEDKNGNQKEVYKNLYTKNVMMTLNRVDDPSSQKNNVLVFDMDGYEVNFGVSLGQKALAINDTSSEDISSVELSDQFSCQIEF